MTERRTFPIRRRQGGIPLAMLALVLGGCAASVSLDEAPDAGRVGAGRPEAARSASPATRGAADDGAVWRAPVAVAYAVAGPAQSPGWNPTFENGAAPGAVSWGRVVDVSRHEFEQKIDDTWTVRQSVRYERPASQPSVAWVEPDRGDEDGFFRQNGLGTFGVSSQAQARFAARGLRHQVKFGFDYLTSRDVLESRLDWQGTPDILDPVYGVTLPASRPLARAYAERRRFGVYAQDEISRERWTLSLVGRSDQNSSRTRDLSADGASALQTEALLSGRVGLRYQFDSGLAPYVNYAQTRAPVAGSPGVAVFGEQVETGVRYQPPGPNPWMTLTAFDQTQYSAQSGACNGMDCRAWAELRVRGASLESRLQPVDGLKLVAAYAVKYAVVSAASDDAQGVLLGNRYPGVAEQTVTLRAGYTVEKGTLAGLSLDGKVGRAGMRYEGAGAGLYTAHTLVDAGVKYDLGRLNPDFKGLHLRASASNALGRDYLAACYLDGCTAGASRAVSATLNYQMPWP